MSKAELEKAFEIVWDFFMAFLDEKENDVKKEIEDYLSDYDAVWDDVNRYGKLVVKKFIEFLKRQIKEEL